MRQEADPGSRRSWLLALVALAAFLAGLAVGQLGAVREPGRSRADWPKPEPPHPRTLSP
jgi:hypothetical protein